jgi:hypothetical protein
LSFYVLCHALIQILVLHRFLNLKHFFNFNDTFIKSFMNATNMVERLSCYYVRWNFSQWPSFVFMSMDFLSIVLCHFSKYIINYAKLCL